MYSVALKLRYGWNVSIILPLSTKKITGRWQFWGVAFSNCILYRGMNSSRKCLLRFPTCYVSYLYCLGILFYAVILVFPQLLKYDGRQFLLLGISFYSFWWFSAGKQLIYCFSSSRESSNWRFLRGNQKICRNQENCRKPYEAPFQNLKKS